MVRFRKPYTNATQPRPFSSNEARLSFPHTAPFCAIGGKACVMKRSAQGAPGAQASVPGPGGGVAPPMSAAEAAAEMQVLRNASAFVLGLRGLDLPTCEGGDGAC